MNKILVLLVVLVVILTTVVIVRGAKDSYKVLPANLEHPLPLKPFDSWRDFASIHGFFKVQLPVLPQHAAESITDSGTKEVRKYDMYVSEKTDGTIFMISLITYPSAQDQQMKEILLDEVIQEMMKSNPNNVLKLKSKIDYQNHEGRDFSIENNEININGREFIIGKTLYLLTYIAKKGSYSKEEFDYFLKNFELTQGKEVKSQRSDKPLVPAE